MIFCLCGRFFSTILTLLQATFKFHIQCLCNTQVTRLPYNSDSYVALVHKKENILSCALVIRDVIIYRHCHSYDFCLQMN